MLYPSISGSGYGNLRPERLLQKKGFSSTWCFLLDLLSVKVMQFLEPKLCSEFYMLMSLCGSSVGTIFMMGVLKAIEQNGKPCI